MPDRSHDESIQPERTSSHYPTPLLREASHLKIEYGLQVEDALAFHDNHMAPQVKAARFRFWLAVSAYFLVVGSLLLWNMSLNPEKTGAAVIGFLIMAVLVFGGSAFGGRRQQAELKRSVRRDRTFSMTRRVILTSDAVESSAGPSASRTLWEGVVKVAATETHLFIYLTKDQAIVIPSRAFESEDDFEDFIEFARQYHRVAHRRQAEE